MIIHREGNWETCTDLGSSRCSEPRPYLAVQAVALEAGRAHALGGGHGARVEAQAPQAPLGIDVVEARGEGALLPAPARIVGPGSECVPRHTMALNSSDEVTKPFPLSFANP